MDGLCRSTRAGLAGSSGAHARAQAMAARGLRAAHAHTHKRALLLSHAQDKKLMQLMDDVYEACTEQVGAFCVHCMRCMRQSACCKALPVKVPAAAQVVPGLPGTGAGRLGARHRSRQHKGGLAAPASSAASSGTAAVHCCRCLAAAVCTDCCCLVACHLHCTGPGAHQDAADGCVGGVCGRWGG